MYHSMAKPSQALPSPTQSAHLREPSSSHFRRLLNRIDLRINYQLLGAASGVAVVQEVCLEVVHVYIFRILILEVVLFN